MLPFYCFFGENGEPSRISYAANSSALRACGMGRTSGSNKLLYFHKSQWDILEIMVSPAGFEPATL